MPHRRSVNRSVVTILKELQELSSPENLKGMARFGINTEKAFGISMPILRNIGKRHKKDHPLAQELWASGYHEARILASIVDDPQQVTENQMETWIKAFNSWDLCDQCCGNLFDKTPFAFAKALEWSRREPEFEKRAGFALMAWLAVHNKRASDDDYIRFFPAIVQEADDSRNFVKKAVNWALRQIGKRNLNLNRLSVRKAQDILDQESKSARWIATDALKELESEAVQRRLHQKQNNLSGTYQVPDKTTKST